MLLAAGAIWIETRPDPTIPHRFASIDLAAGTVIDESNTETRPVPVGMFEPVEIGSTAIVAVPAGDPILSSTVGEAGSVAPKGWWVIEVRLPLGAMTGDASRLVLLDSGEVVEGVVVKAATDDPLGSGLGMVAVEPEAAADAARAAAEGRIAIMLAPG